MSFVKNQNIPQILNLHTMSSSERVLTKQSMNIWFKLIQYIEF